MLNKLCCLYALWRIDQNMGWYLTNKYLAPNKASAIQQEINKICGELRPHVASLVDCFGLPDHVVRAPIAFDWVKEGSQGFSGEEIRVGMQRAGRTPPPRVYDARGEAEIEENANVAYYEDVELKEVEEAEKAEEEEEEDEVEDGPSS